MLQYIWSQCHIHKYYNKKIQQIQFFINDHQTDNRSREKKGVIKTAANAQKHELDDLLGITVTD